MVAGNYLNYKVRFLFIKCFYKCCKVKFDIWNRNANICAGFPLEEDIF